MDFREERGNRIQFKAVHRTKDTDPRMATSIQFIEIPAGLFGRIDRRSDCYTSRYSLRNRSWTASPGVYNLFLFSIKLRTKKKCSFLT